MKSFLTLLDTLKTHDGNRIIYRPDKILEFFKRTYEENYMNLSKEEKEEGFLVDQQYGDLLMKIFKEPIHNLLNADNSDTSISYIIQTEQRNPTEEYEYALAIPKDDYVTEEEYNLKMERLRLHKEWFESQND